MAADFAPAFAPDAPAAEAPAPTEVAFVDWRVLGQDALGLQRDGMLVVVLDSNQDGVAQISEVLAQHQGLKAVHILAHGDAGEMFLGTSVLDGQAIAEGKVAGWGQALSGDGDVLLYGCNVAEGAAGQAFVQQLAAATGADVGASTDATGNAAAGGNWTLEYAVGTLESAPIEAQALAGLLATFTGTSGTDSFTTGNSGNDIYNFASANLTAADTITDGGGTDELRITDAASLVDAAFTNVSGVEKIVFGNFANSLTLGTEAQQLAASVGGTLEVDARAGTGSNTTTVNASAFTAAAGILYDAGAGIDNVTGGAGDDTISVISWGGADSFVGGGGTDTLDFSNVATTLLFTFSAGSVTISNGATSVSATGFERIIGGSGVNTFKLAAGGSFAGTIVGNGTLNTLDYSLYGSGATVNLATGAATAISGGAAGKVSEITRVVGSAFNDSFTDGGDGDTYEGGAGDDSYAFLDDWGTDTVTDSGGANTLDFGGASSGADFALNGATTVVTEGSNRLTLTLTGAATLAEVHGTSGDDVFTADIGLTVATDLYGGDGDDTFRAQVGSDFSGSVDGEAGSDDAIDYTLRHGNAQYDTATGEWDNFSGGIAGIETVQHPLDVPDGVAAIAALIQDGIDATVGSIDIPMLGNIGGEANSFIDDIASAVVDGLTAALRVDIGHVNEDGDPSSTGDLIEEWLVDTLQVNFTSSIPGATLGTFGLVAIDSDHMEFALVIEGVIFEDSWDLDFAGAIPGLGLDMDAQIDVSLTYALRLAFGVDYSDITDPQFYFDTNGADDADDSDDDEITLTLTATMPYGDILSPDIIATLGFLQFEVTSYDNSAQKQQDSPGTNSLYQDNRLSGITGTFAIDLMDPGSNPLNTWAEDDGRLTHSEIGDANFKLNENIAAKFHAFADVDLYLRVSADVVAAGLPSVQFYLHYDQTFVDSVILFNGANQTSFGAAPTVVFEDLSLNLGSFISDFIHPILEQVQVFTEPLQPIVDFLKSDIPILSDIGFLKDLLNKDGQGGVDVLDFAGTILGNTKYGSIVTAVNAIVELIDLVNSIPSEGDILINFGTYTFGGGGNDLRGAGSKLAMPTSTPDETAMRNKVNNSSATADTKSFLEKLKRDPVGGGFSVPILTEPAEILKLITGRTANLFFYDLPELNFDFTFRKSVPIVFPLNMVMEAGFGVTVRLGFGYDSRGIQEAIANGFSDPSVIFKGFFIDDHGVEGSGSDLDEVVINSHFSVGASVGVGGIIEAGVEGGVTGIIGFDFNDVDAGLGYDGKIYFDELDDLFTRQGPLGFINVHGSLDWFLQAFVWVGLDLGFFGKITLYDETFDLGSGNIVTFENHYTVAIPPNVAHQSGGDLVLHMGADANQRDDGPGHGGYADLDGNAAETFSVDLSDDGNFYVVNYKGTTQSFAKGSITRIVVNDAQGGNDVLTVGEGVTAGLLFNGGAGNDKVTYLGTGTATIHGGNDDDRITVKNGPGILYGDGGNDTITGGDFADQIYGGAGNDKIKGGGGNDWIEGGLEPVAIDPTSGKANGDTIDGGDGDDVIYGGEANGAVNFTTPPAAKSGESGSDVIKGGKGNDRIYGGDENESLTLASGKRLGDTIDGGADDDTIFAGGGHDTIKGGTGNDVLWGGSGDDAFTGGAGIDQIRGEAGNDSINWAVGDGADSTIDGGTGNDTIVVTGADADTNITLSRVGATADLQLDWGSDSLVLASLEKFALNAGTGLDHFVINDLAGTTAKEIAMSLGASQQEVTRYDWDGDGTIETTEGAPARYLLDSTGAQILNAAGQPVYDDFGVLSEVVRLTAFDSYADTVTIKSGSGADQFTGETRTDAVSGGSVVNLSRTGTINLSYSIAQSGAALDTFLLQTFAGDDSIDLSGVRNASFATTTIEAGDNDDTVFGTQFADTINSGLGNDKVSGNGGIDTFIDAGGTDILSEVNDGSPTFNGGATGTTRTYFDLTNANFTLNGNSLSIVRGAVTETENISVFEEVGLVAGTGANTFTVQNWAKIARLDGGAGSDTYNIHFMGSGNGSVTENDSVHVAGNVDRMFLYGTSGGDNFSFTADNENDTILTDGTVTVTHGPSGSETVESVHYTHSEELEVRGGAGNDVFSVDDNALTLRVYGEAGNDSFVIGRVTASHIDPGTGAQVADAVTNGISSESFFYGDFGEDGSGNEINVAQSGNDEFEVNHNLAPLWLYGNAGDDRFVVNAILVQDAGGTPTNPNNVSGGSGSNLITYLQNAPVNIDGGSGNDVVVVNGTGISDTFIIAVVMEDDDPGPGVSLVAKQKVIGAGLQINMKNVERLEVNGAGGDDFIHVFSTLPDLEVVVSGGSGNDTIHIGGEAVAIVVDPPAYTVDPPAYTYDPPAYIDHWNSVSWSWGDYWYFDWTLPFWHYQPLVTYTWWYPVWFDPAPVTIDPPPQTIDPAPFQFSVAQTNLVTGIQGKLTIDAGAVDSSGGTNDDDRLVVHNTAGNPANTLTLGAGDHDGLAASPDVGYATGLGMTQSDGAGGTIVGGFYYLNVENLDFYLSDDTATGDDVTITYTDPDATTTIFGGLGNDHFRVKAANGVVQLDGGGGNDSFDVWSDAFLLDGIAGTLRINGGAGTDSVDIRDTGDGTGDIGTLTASALTGLDMAGSIQYGTFATQTFSYSYLFQTVNGSPPPTVLTTHNTQTFTLAYAPIENLTIGLGSGHDQFDITGTQAVTTVNANDGDDTINVSSDGAALQGSLDAVAGALTLHFGIGNNTFNISDLGDTDPDATVVVASGSITGLAPAAVAYDATGGRFAGGVNIWTGRGNDGITLASTVTGDVTTIDANDGDDAITVSGGQAANMIVLRGGLGQDTLNAAATSTLPIVLIGDRGEETYGTTTKSFASLTAVRSLANAGGAGDTLTGGTGRLFAIGGEGGDGVTSNSSLADVLIGDNGEILFGTSTIVTRARSLHPAGALGGVDILSAGAGNNILIGGLGGDTLSALGGNDIMIGDNGDVTFDAAGVIDLAESTEYDQGGGDTLSAGDGKNVVIGGYGGDTITLGAGDDAAIGDNGRLDYTITGGVAVLTRAETTDDDGVASGTGGDDIVVAGDGFNVVLAGQGADHVNDTITSPGSVPSAGTDVVLGDNGYVTWTAAGVITAAVSTQVGQGGVDVIAVGEGDNVVIGGAGGDRVSAGGGIDVLIGDNGQATWTGGVVTQMRSSDTLAGTGGNDILAAGGGRNYVVGGVGRDDITSGSGDDVVLGDNGVVNFTAAGIITDAAVTEVGLGDVDTIDVGAGNNVVLAGAAGDSVTTLGGDDVIIGDSGSAAWTGGVLTQIRSSDTTSGTGGNDTISAGAGRNYVVGGVGDDGISTGADDDVVLGDNGVVNFTALGVITDAAVTEIGLGGIDTIDADAGNNVVLAGAAGDSVTTLGGDDVIIGDSGDATWTGGVLTRIRSSDTTGGTGGDDTINAGEGRNYIVGGVGGDTITSGAGDDVVMGDNGVVNFTAAGVITDATATELGVGGVDIVNAGGGNNVVVGGAGGDSVTSLGGNDTILGDNGNLTFTGGILTEAVTTDTSGATGGDDTLSAGDGINVVLGGVGNDSLTTGGGNDVVVGDNGIAQFNASGALLLVESRDPLLAGNDAINAGGGNDVVIGGSGADTIEGGAGNDVLIGDGGTATFSNGSLFQVVGDTQYGDADYISGGGGNDILIGGAGNDTMAANLTEDLFTGGNARITFSGGLVTNIELLGGVDLILQALFDSYNSTGSEGETIIQENNAEDGSGGGTGLAESLFGGFGAEGIFASDGTLVLPGQNALSFSLGRGVPLAQIPELLRNILLEISLGNGNPAPAHGGESGVQGGDGQAAAPAAGDQAQPAVALGAAPAPFAVEAEATTLPPQPGSARAETQDETLALAAGAAALTGMARPAPRPVLERDAFAPRRIDW